MEFTLNIKKTTVLRRNLFEEESITNFTEIRKEFVKILGDYDFHRYIDRLLSSSPSNQSNIEFQNRQRTT